MAGLIVWFQNCGGHLGNSGAAAQPSTDASPGPVGPVSIFRIDTGSTVATTDSLGRPWQADQYFTGGSTVDRGTGMAIANTNDDRIMQTERYAMSNYTIPLPNGTYTLKLYFAETSTVTAAGQRVFDVAIQGQTALSNLDIFAEAGYATELVKTFSVSVTNGSLVISFTTKSNSPCIQGIEILQ